MKIKLLLFFFLHKSEFEQFVNTDLFQCFSHYFFDLFLKHLSAKLIIQIINSY